MRYGSICSGIEAATVAWKPLGFEPAFFSEIDDQARAVLKYHYPNVPLHGDFTTIKAEDYGAIDILIGGTPCQSFSVAGLRGGIADARGNLTLEFLRLVERKKPRWVVWENVPGVLSATSHDAPDPVQPPPPMDLECDGQEMESCDEYDSQELHAFNCFLAGLQQLGYGASYRILDAQYFGVPQRRRRVFVIGYFGDWRPAAAVFFESESLRWDITPRRETGQDVAGTITSRADGGGGGPEQGDGAAAGYLQPVISPTLDGRSGRSGCNSFATSGGLIHCPPVSPTIKARDHKGASSDGFNDGAPLIAHMLNSDKNDHRIYDTRNGMSPKGSMRGNEISHTLLAKEAEPPLLVHTLRGEGFDASEDGTGRGTPLVAVPINSQIGLRGADTSNSSKDGVGIGKDGDPMFTLQAHHHHAVALTIPIHDKATRHKGGGSDRNDDGSSNGMGIGKPSDPSPTLDTASRHAVFSQASKMAVRRLMPIECERLQAFPDNYTLVPYQRKMMADGPRYKMIGNSMHTGTIKWLGERIKMIEGLL